MTGSGNRYTDMGTLDTAGRGVLPCPLPCRASGAAGLRPFAHERLSWLAVLPRLRCSFFGGPPQACGLGSAFCLLPFAFCLLPFAFRRASAAAGYGMMRDPAEC